MIKEIINRKNEQPFSDAILEILSQKEEGILDKLDKAMDWFKDKINGLFGSLK